MATSPKITVYKGDDTTFKGEKRLRVTIDTRVSLAGCSAEFELCGLVKRIPDISTGTFYVNITGDETRRMPCGTHNAVLRAYDDEGRCRTISNSIRVEVTDRVEAAYSRDDEINVHLGATVKWRDVVDKPSINGHVLEGNMTTRELGIKGVEQATLVDLPEDYTPDELRNSINAINDVLRRSMAALAALLLVPLAMFAEDVRVETRELGDMSSMGKQFKALSNLTSVVTSVNLAGLTTDRGTARPLPPYLYAFDFSDSYEAEAEAYYLRYELPAGGCSCYREGNEYARNYDWNYDESATFVVRMSACSGRHASVGVASVGTNITEQMARSGDHLPPQFYKALPGMTLDGINDAGVFANINVVASDEAMDAGWSGTNLCALGAVRYVLDHFDCASNAAHYVAANAYIPGKMRDAGYGFHFMVGDGHETWVVEDGVAHNATKDGRVAMTNFRLYADDDPYGTGYERYDILTNGQNISAAWFKEAYRRPFSRPTEFASAELGITHTMTNALKAWADANIPQGAPETLNRNGKSWQTVHSSVYDISNRTVRIAVQEAPDWYTFAVPSAGGVDEGAVRTIVEPMIEGATNDILSAANDHTYLALTNTDATAWMETSATNSLAWLASHHDPADPDFSNAVVSVALPIGTNELAALRELGGLPVDAMGLGAVVLALAAAVAALRRAMLENVERSQATDAAQSAALAAQARALTEVQEDAHAAKDKATEAHDKATEAAAGVEELKDASGRNQATDAAQSAALAAQANALTHVIEDGKQDYVLTRFSDQIERCVQVGHRRPVASYYPQYAKAPALTFLHLSDIHGEARLNDAIEVFNYLARRNSCKFLLATGDIHYNTFASDYTKIAEALSKTSYPTYIVCGNHDLGNIGYKVDDCPTNRQVWERMFAPIVGNWNLHMAAGSGGSIRPDIPDGYDEDIDAVCSWATDFEDEKVRLIGIHAYDTSYETVDGDPTTLKGQRGYHAVRQEEIDWLVETLMTTPAGYGVIIAIHDDIDYTGALESPWNYDCYRNMKTGFFYFESSALCEIVQAFIDGSKISKTWNQSVKSGRGPFSVDADFSGKNAGAHFVAWVNGHRHVDGINFLRDFPNQLELNIKKYWEKNEADETSYPNMNLVSVEIDRHMVSVIRVGDGYSQNGDGSVCDFIQLDYRGRDYRLDGMRSVSEAIKDLAERNGASASIIDAD